MYVIYFVERVFLIFVFALFFARGCVFTTVLPTEQYYTRSIVVHCVSTSHKNFLRTALHRNRNRHRNRNHNRNL